MYLRLQPTHYCLTSHPGRSRDCPGADGARLMLKSERHNPVLHGTPLYVICQLGSHLSLVAPPDQIRITLPLPHGLGRGMAEFATYSAFSLNDGHDSTPDKGWSWRLFYLLASPRFEGWGMGE